MAAVAGPQRSHVARGGSGGAARLLSLLWPPPSALVPHAVTQMLKRSSSGKSRTPPQLQPPADLTQEEACQLDESGSPAVRCDSASSQSSSADSGSAGTCDGSSTDEGASPADCGSPEDEVGPVISEEDMRRLEARRLRRLRRRHQQQVWIAEAMGGANAQGGLFGTAARPLGAGGTSAGTAAPAADPAAPTPECAAAQHVPPGDTTAPGPAAAVAPSTEAGSAAAALRALKRDRRLKKKLQRPLYTGRDERVEDAYARYNSGNVAGTSRHVAQAFCFAPVTRLPWLPAIEEDAAAEESDRDGADSRVSCSSEGSACGTLVACQLVCDLPAPKTRLPSVFLGKGGAKAASGASVAELSTESTTPLLLASPAAVVGCA